MKFQHCWASLSMSAMKGLSCKQAASMLSMSTASQAYWQVAVPVPAAHRPVTFSLQYLAMRISGALYLQTRQRLKWQQFSAAATPDATTRTGGNRKHAEALWAHTWILTAGSSRHSGAQVAALQATYAGTHLLAGLDTLPNVQAVSCSTDKMLLMQTRTLQVPVPCHQ